MTIKSSKTLIEEALSQINTIEPSEAKKLQEETAEHYTNFSEKVDSINNTFERMDFKVDQLNEVLSSRIDILKDDLESLNEEFSSYKRTSQRDAMKMKKMIESIQDDIDKINIKLNEEFGED